MVYPADVLRPIVSLNDHHSGCAYDEASLRAEISSAGFVDIINCRPGDSDDELLRGIDSRTEPIDAVVLVTLEARKP
jgi:hypothetical protein